MMECRPLRPLWLNNYENFDVLKDLIAFKLQYYNEPVRAGTPKGCKIGLSAKKYYAALLCVSKQIHGTSLKKIAGMVGVSYKLLRKWRSEKDFNAVTDSFSSEFASFTANPTAYFTSR